MDGKSSDQSHRGNSESARRKAIGERLRLARERARAERERIAGDSLRADIGSASQSIGGVRADSDSVGGDGEGEPREGKPDGSPGGAIGGAKSSSGGGGSGRRIGSGSGDIAGTGKRKYRHRKRTAKKSRKASSDNFRLGEEPSPHATKGQAEAKAEEKKISEAALVGLIAVGATALYGTVAQWKGAHWNLEQQEALALAKATHKAIETLPGATYEKIEKLIAIFLPWIALAITAGTITAKRIERDRDLSVESGAPKQNGSTNGRDVRGFPGPFTQSGFSAYN